MVMRPLTLCLEENKMELELEISKDKNGNPVLKKRNPDNILEIEFENEEQLNEFREFLKSFECEIAFKEFKGRWKG